MPIEPPEILRQHRAHLRSRPRESRPAIPTPKFRRQCASRARHRGRTNCRGSCRTRFRAAVPTGRRRPIPLPMPHTAGDNMELRFESSA